MKTIKNITINLLLFVIILCGSTYARYVNVGGNIVETTVWSADTVYFASDVIVEDGATLTINPGTVVICNGSIKDSVHKKFNDDYYWETFNRPPEFLVRGRLLAVGNETDSITFDLNTASTQEEFWPGINFDPGMRFDTTSFLSLPYSSLSAGAYLQVFTAGKIMRTNKVTVTR